MGQLLIEIPHREEDCFNLVRLLRLQGSLGDFRWGCQTGVHMGWAVIAGYNEAEARLVVPPFVRGQARVVKVSKFGAPRPGQPAKNEWAALSPVVLGMYKAFPCWW